MSFFNPHILKSLTSLKSTRVTGQKNSWLAPRFKPNSARLSPDGSCIHHLFEQQVRRTPQAIAVVTEEAQLTYQQLNRQANRLAYQLSTSGVGPNQLVGVYVECSLDLVVGWLGILKAGGAYVPIDPHNSTEHIEFILKNIQTNILLSQTHLEHTVSSYLPDKNTTIICLDRDQWTNMRSCPDLTIPVTPDHLMSVIYTSSCTEHPEELMIPHSRICRQLTQQQTNIPAANLDQTLETIPISFDLDGWKIFCPLVVGDQLVLPK